MLGEKSTEVALWLLNGDPSTPRPAKTTLPPSGATFDMLEMIKKARAGLNRLAAEHFFPVDVALEKQPEFTNRDREKLSGDRRMNIGLSEQIVNSKEYANFYVSRLFFFF